MRLHLFAAVTALGLCAVLASACSDEAGKECTQSSECDEVGCPDGTKLKTCVDGECLTFDACESGSGGW